MKEAYLEVTYRHGGPLAAYAHLPAPSRRKSVRTQRIEPGLVIDFSATEQALGIEITALKRLTLTRLNQILRGIDCPPIRRDDLAPLYAA
jgi:hypothetical protein